MVVTGIQTNRPLRIEDNYIENSVIQESIDEGTATPMKKKDKVEHSETVKCRILIRGDETEDNPYKQKEGDPPDPENAPPPKKVRDKGKGKGKGKGKTGGKGTKGTKGASRSYQYWGSSSRSKGGGSKGHWEYHTPKPRSQYSEWQPTRKVTYKDSSEKSDRWSKDSTWARNKESNERKYDNKSYGKKSYDNKSYDNKSYDNKSYDKKSYDNKSYDKKSYDNKSYENKSYDKSNGKYDKNQAKEGGWSKPTQTKDEKWNSKWESKQDSSRNNDKWGASKKWEGKDANWEKKQVAAYTDGGSQKSRAQWDSKGSWKEDNWKKSEENGQKSYGSNYSQSQRSAKGGAEKRTQQTRGSEDGKISEAERSRRWGDQKNQSWNQDGSRDSKDDGKGKSDLAVKHGEALNGCEFGAQLGGKN